MVSFFLVWSAEWFGLFQFFKILLPNIRLDFWTAHAQSIDKAFKNFEAMDCRPFFLEVEKSTKFCCSAEAKLLELVCYGKYGFSKPEISQLKVNARKVRNKEVFV